MVKNKSRLDKTNNSTYWAGSIDEIRFYEGQLSILDINNLFEAGR